MKLLTVTSRANVVGMVTALILSGAILFVMLRVVILDELDEQLSLKAQRVESAIAEGHSFYDPFTSITEFLGTKAADEINVFSDTLIYDDAQSEYEDYRMLQTIRVVNGQAYTIRTATSRVEWEDFMGIIFFVFLGTSALLLAAMYFVNQRLTKRIWTPFFNNLRTLQSFSLQSRERIQLEESSVQEFVELNEVLDKMTSKVQQDYQVLRDFTESASHEIQTPLAVILSGLDRLGQSTDLNEEIALRIQSIRKAATTLSKLNRDLLLLTKIENHQFNRISQVDLAELIRSQVSMMEDLFTLKKIKVEVQLPKNYTVKADQSLMEILLSNLISNGYRYTSPDGEFRISSNPEAINFSNPGTPFKVDSKRLFERFYKGTDSSGSHGLGLSIVNQICAANHWRIEYSYSKERHNFTIHF